MNKDPVMHAAAMQVLAAMEAVAALTKLIDNGTVRIEPTCPLCGGSTSAPSCHKQGCGEWCSLPRGHAGEHWCALGGYRWDDSCNDRPGSTCWGDGICRARGDYSNPFSQSTGCQLPKNHDGPHQLSESGHAAGCHLALFLELQAEGKEP